MIYSARALMGEVSELLRKTLVNNCHVFDTPYSKMAANRLFCLHVS